MTLEELRKHYYIPQNKHEGHFLFHDIKTGNCRMVHKYFCMVKKNGNRWKVEGYPSTNKLEVLQANIKDYVSKLPYDSEYYFPLYNSAIFVSHIIHDYLNSVGFKLDNMMNKTTWYTLERKTIYGNTGQRLSVFITGLEAEYEHTKTKFEQLPLREEVEIGLSLGDWSWVEVKAKREPEAIKKAFDSLMKPYLIGESVGNFKAAEKLVNEGDTDIILQGISGSLELQSVEYKQELKKKLLEMAEKL